MPSLADTLRRWLPHLDWQDGNGRDGVIDLATLDELTGGDYDVAGSILADYVDSLDTDLIALATALTDAGAEDVRRVAHGIKGAASTVGAREVAALAARLEALASPRSTTGTSCAQRRRPGRRGNGPHGASGGSDTGLQLTPWWASSQCGHAGATRRSPWPGTLTYALVQNGCIGQGDKETRRMLSRAEATELVLDAKLRRAMSFEELARVAGRNEVWVATALLGQATMSPEEARAVTAALGLDGDVAAALAQIPSRGAFQGEVPVDPLLYRLFEIIQVFGPAVKAVINERFGDGIMSAIDFELGIERKPDPKGDRVVITLDGKFLPYRKW
jgi:cyanate lyase